MKAVRLHRYAEQPLVEEVAEPKISNPHDVIVRIGGAGLCRTDLHIIEGQLAAKNAPLPYILGHENAGWVYAVGSAVSNVAVGDTVIVHPVASCGFCRACRAGQDTHCSNSTFPGISSEINFIGNLVGTYNDLTELMTLTAQGKVTLHTATYPLAAANDAIHDLETGRLRGRGILIP